VTPAAVVYRWAVQALVTTLGFGAATLGLAVYLGGMDRFGGAPFATARLVPGSPWTWGLVIGLAGVLTLVGAAMNSRRFLRTGLFIQAFWYLFFDISLIAAAVADPHVPLTGCVIYLMISAVVLVVWGASRDLLFNQLGG
jgi:hypothetical protein